jgi:hypothetical protein
MAFSLARHLTRSIAIACLVMTTACTSSSTSSAPVPSSSATIAASPSASVPVASSSSNKIESDGIDLEFVAAPEAKQTHLDVFVKTAGVSIPTAQVEMQVQTPDGQTRAVAMKYDQAGQHFAGVLTSTTQGQYQVKVSVKANGKTADGRFSFDR